MSDSVMTQSRSPELAERTVPCAVSHRHSFAAPIAVPNVYSKLKLLMDVSLASLASLALWPLILILAAAVKLTSRGPAFYLQTRVGRGGRLFRIYKLRTMTVDAESKGARWAVPMDPRITPIGQFLRRTHLDELPQLINVLRLEMSLVGPRPERPEIIPALEASIPDYRERLAVRPGVTGLAQLRLPADTCIADVKRKLVLDRYYIDHMGPWMDTRLILCTVFKVVRVPLKPVLRLLAVPGEQQRHS